MTTVNLKYLKNCFEAIFSCCFRNTSRNIAKLKCVSVFIHSTKLYNKKIKLFTENEMKMLFSLLSNHFSSACEHTSSQVLAEHLMY